MSYPKRWLDDGSGSTELERDLLRSGDDVEPPPAARADVWAAIANRLPPGGGGGGGGGGAPSAGGGGLGGGAIKIVAGIVVVSAAAVAVIAAIMMRTPSPTAPPVAGTTPPASVEAPLPPSAMPTSAATRDEGSVGVPQPEATASVAKPRTAPGPARPAAHMTSTAATKASAAAVSSPNAVAPVASATTKVDALREENGLLAQARQSLRQGDAAGALAKIETAKARFPNGALVQEREVLAIEALAQSGNSDAASRRASAFLQAFPSSPHASHVRTFVR